MEFLFVKSNKAADNVWGFSNNPVLRAAGALLRSVIKTGHAFIIFTISAKGHNSVFGNQKPHYPQMQNTIDGMDYIKKLSHSAASKHAKL